MLSELLMILTEEEQQFIYSQAKLDKGPLCTHQSLIEVDPDSDCSLSFHSAHSCERMNFEAIPFVVPASVATEVRETLQSTEEDQKSVSEIDLQRQMAVQLQDKMDKQVKVMKNQH